MWTWLVVEWVTLLLGPLLAYLLWSPLLQQFGFMVLAGVIMILFTAKKSLCLFIVHWRAWEIEEIAKREKLEAASLKGPSTTTLCSEIPA